jgi:hypothetical protein
MDEEVQCRNKNETVSHPVITTIVVMYSVVEERVVVKNVEVENMYNIPLSLTWYNVTEDKSVHDDKMLGEVLAGLEEKPVYLSSYQADDELPSVVVYSAMMELKGKQYYEVLEQEEYYKVAEREQFYEVTKQEQYYEVAEREQFYGVTKQKEYYEVVKWELDMKKSWQMWSSPASTNFPLRGVLDVASSNLSTCNLCHKSSPLWVCVYRCTAVQLYTRQASLV